MRDVDHSVVLFVTVSRRKLLATLRKRKFEIGDSLVKTREEHNKYGITSTRPSAAADSVAPMRRCS